MMFICEYYEGMLKQVFPKKPLEAFLPTLKVVDQVLPEVADIWGNDVFLPIFNIPCGIEIEVENAMRLPSRSFQWIIDKDNSLRGEDAYEYKTPLGVTVGTAMMYLRSLEKAVKSYRKRYGEHLWKYSERCSIHVHLDVRLFSRQQMVNLLMLYTLFEEPLFDLAGVLRKHNIFCIPFASSGNMFAAESLQELIAAGEKYTALNLACIREFGTVEFRHMEGTLDMRRLFVWLLLLGRLHVTAQTMKPQVLADWLFKLKSESLYYDFADLVFTPVLRQFLKLDPVKFDGSVSDAKMFLNTKD